MNRILASFLGVVVTCLPLSDFATEPGYYAVTERDGVAWFQDPQGTRFFSLGVSDIGPGVPRKSYNPDHPAYAALQQYDSNEEWASDTITRLKSWHFNTLGSWVDPSLTSGQLPYAEVLHLGAHVGAPWNDLFSDEFAAQIDKLAKDRVAKRSQDRNLLGWFTDNELGWYPDTLFHYHLSRAGTSASRTEVVRILREHYGNDFSALQQDFDVTGAATFDDLLTGSKLKLRAGKNGRTVILKFAKAAAERYYRVTHDAIRRYDMNHLILGDRYPCNCPKEVAEAAGPYVDVISTNLDWPEATDGYLPCGYLANLHRWSGRPVLLGEYYVAAQENRSGNKNTGGVFLTVANQSQRAQAAKDRLQLLVEQPYIVGAHWFRYADEPTHGRSDGEDYDFGLVDIHNQPYEKLVAAMTRLNRDVPRIHADSAKADYKTKGAVSIPRIVGEVEDLHNQLLRMQSLGSIDGSLGIYGAVGAWTPEKLFLVAMLCHVSERETYSGDIGDECQLELDITAGKGNSPLRIRFGGPTGFRSDDNRVKGWVSANGLRYTLAVAIPAALLHQPALKLNGELDLQLSFRDLLNGDSADCQNKCVLVGEKCRDISLPAEISGSSSQDSHEEPRDQNASEGR